jgi:hypothetical protein
MGALRVKIVGAKHHEGAEALIGTLMPGTPITLVREPTNPYDKSCVAVHIDGSMAGYVPRYRNRDLAIALDTGRDVTAEATEIPGEILVNWKD